MIILQRNALSLCRAYRDYLGKAYQEQIENGQNPDLEDDIKVRVFLKTVDCPDTWGSVVRFWNSSIGYYLV